MAKKRISLVTILHVALVSLLLPLILVSLIDFSDRKNGRACATADPAPKAIVFLVLYEQRAYHYNKGKFLSSFNSLKEALRGHGDSLELLEERSERWNIAIANYGNYTTVEISPKVKYSSERAYYNGVLSFNSSEEDERAFDEDYHIFICSTAKSDAAIELHPTGISEGKLVFKCPPNTHEDC